MSQIKDVFLRKLMHSYSRYILLTVAGSSTLLLSFDWTAETSLLSAAGLAVLLELLLSGHKAKPDLNEKINSYNPQLISLDLQQSDD